MPIKVTYQDDKGNPIEAPKEERPITLAEKELWEKMQAEAYKQHIYEEDLNTPEGMQFMKDQGIDLDRLPAYRADIAQKEKEQQDNPEELPQVVAGFSSKDVYNDLAPRQRYVHYLAQEDGQTKDFGTDMETFVADQNKQKAIRNAQWAGYGDPTADVNYRAPGTQSGFGSSPGMSSTVTPVAPDPRFPTRNPITGVVTPAVQPPPSPIPAPEEPAEDEEG